MAELPSKADYLASLVSLPAPTDDSECAICRKEFRDEPDNGVVLPDAGCVHILHRECLEAWLVMDSRCLYRHQLFKGCRCCQYCTVMSSLNTFAQSTPIQAAVLNILEGPDSQDRHMRALAKMKTEVQASILSKLSIQSQHIGDLLGSALATVFVRRFGSGLSAEQWAEVCDHRRSMYDLALGNTNQLPPFSLPNFSMVRFLRHESTLEYRLSIPDLFGISTEEQGTVLVMLSESDTGFRLRQKILPLQDQYNISPNGETYQHVTLSKELELVVAEASPGWVTGVDTTSRPKTIEISSVTGHMVIVFRSAPHQSQDPTLAQAQSAAEVEGPGPKDDEVGDNLLEAGVAEEQPQGPEDGDHAIEGQDTNAETIRQDEADDDED